MSSNSDENHSLNQDSTGSSPLGGGWVGASLFLILGGVIAYMCFREQKTETDFDNLVKDYERQIERLNSERDSLYRALSLREQQYRHITDSLQAVMIKIQTAQTQNKLQYETRRDSIILLPDDERYRYVTDYIKRYNSHTNSGCDSKSRPE